MLELSIALVIIAAMAYRLINKVIDQKNELNTKSVQAELDAAIIELNKQFDERLNKTWGTISSIKQELEAFKLVTGIRNNKQ